MMPEEIKAGRSYLLRPKYVVAKPAVRRVIAINGEKVTVEINGEPKDFMIKTFTDLAQEEVNA